jgi:hydroxyacylglutathione hydrolase
MKYTEAKIMHQVPKLITLRFPFRMGSVNCYLIQSDTGYLLIDSGMPSSRKALLRELERLGCQPGLLKLIVLTHGDFDHTGNAATLRGVFGAKIAMHRDDAGMATDGDMFFNRKQPNALLRKLAPLFIGFGKEQRFTPDVLLEDGDDLSAFGFDARVFSLPGHSKGSIGVLTAAGDLFCGDLLVNTDKPALNTLIDDMPAAEASLQRLVSLDVGTVYPGHGKPFPFRLLKKS